MSVPHGIKSAEHRRQLLTLARRTASHALGACDVDKPDALHAEGRFGGVFVTFWSGKTLRGCVGTFAPTDDVASAVAEMTRASLCDSRFAANPIVLDELPSLTIELSVLSDPQPMRDSRSLIPGLHGVVVRRGERTGCFLPKVAIDRGWSAEEFLSKCCSMKAELPEDAWRDIETEVRLFQADVISESDGHVPGEKHGTKSGCG